ncbi:hypothetical protein MKW92_036685 [Papaver armeniacum]|nr:hypothetical protein MKW92_036685 [Papaver armeniacum]
MAGIRCCQNPPDLGSSSGSNGCVEEVGGLQSYVSGFEAPNLRNLADKVAATGYYVVVPDFFHGDPYTPDKDLLVWFQSQGTDMGTKEAKAVIEALKVKGVSDVGAAGIELAKSDDLKAIVMMHPALVTVDDIKEIKVPISILGAEVDELSPPELVKQFEQVLLTKSDQVPSFVKIFNGVEHGWTVRYDIENKEAVKHAEEAHTDMLGWLSKYVK